MMTWAHKLVRFLGDKGLIELAPGQSPLDLASKVDSQFSLTGDIVTTAKELSRWLIDDDGVVELYVDDETLSQILVDLA